MTPTAILRFTESGDIQLAVHGAGFRFLVVDERCPADRVFEVTAQIDAATLAVLVPAGCGIGRAGDGSNEAEVAAALAAAGARPVLQVIEGGLA